MRDGVHGLSCHGVEPCDIDFRAKTGGTIKYMKRLQTMNIMKSRNVMYIVKCYNLFSDTHFIVSVAFLAHRVLLV